MYPHNLAMLGKGRGGGEGRREGQGHTLSSSPVPPKEDRLKEQTRSPLSLGKKRFRDNGGGKHSRAQVGKGTLRGRLNL